MASESSFSGKERLFVGILILLAMLLTTVAVVPSLRARVKSLFQSQDRHIIAKVSGRVGPDGPTVTVLKINSEAGLSLEIYSADQGPDHLVLLAKFNLGEKRDAYFSFQGNATNLALTDVNGDGILEVVAPAYDDQMVARLNVFSYNSATKSFERMINPEN